MKYSPNPFMIHTPHSCHDCRSFVPRHHPCVLQTTKTINTHPQKWKSGKLKPAFFCIFTLPPEEQNKKSLIPGGSFVTGFDLFVPRFGFSFHYWAPSFRSRVSLVFFPFPSFSWLVPRFVFFVPKTSLCWSTVSFGCSAVYPSFILVPHSFVRYRISLVRSVV